MSHADTTIWQRFRQFPRAAQWAVLAAIGIGLFWAYDKHVRPLTRSWNDQANRMLAELDEATRSDGRDRQLRALREPILALGTVEMPSAEAEGSNPLSDAVNAVLNRHSVTKDSFTTRPPAKLPRGTLSQIIAADEHLARITGNLRFDAGPDEATAIITELEDSPEIEAISSLRITRHSGRRKVTVDLTVEAWIVSVEPTKGTGGV